MQFTAVSLLHSLGVPAQAAFSPTGADGNNPEVRDAAIQTTASYMHRMAVDGSQAFQISPLCIELSFVEGVWQSKETNLLVAAFEVGYIWSKGALSDAHPNIRKPQKGTRFDDLMNAWEYIVTGKQIPNAPSVAMLAHAQARYQTAPEREILKRQMEQSRLLRAQQRDRDPSDRKVGPRVGRRGML